MFDENIHHLQLIMQCASPFLHAKDLGNILDPSSPFAMGISCILMRIVNVILPNFTGSQCWWRTGQNWSISV